MITTVNELIESVQTEAHPPDGLSDPLRSLWFAKKGNWEDAHNIAQDIDTPLGSWIHAHLHLVEGDLWNAGYWYAKAEKPASTPEMIDEEWVVIASHALDH